MRRTMADRGLPLFHFRVSRNILFVISLIIVSVLFIVWYSAVISTDPSGGSAKEEGRRPSKSKSNHHRIHLPSHHREGKILVTGCLGYLGFELIHRLIVVDRQEVIGVDVSPLDILEPPDIQSLEDHRMMMDNDNNNYGSSSGLFRFVQGDIRNESLLSEIFEREKIRGVIHAAFLSEESVCEMLPESCRSINVEGTRSMLKRIQRMHSESRPWLIFVSGREVYGGYRPSDLPVNEGTPKRPGSTLGVTRVEAEGLVEAARRCGGPAIRREHFLEKDQEREKNKEAEEREEENGKKIDAIILRFSEIYGSTAGDTVGGGKRFVTRLVHSAIKKTALHFVNREAVLDLLHVQDAVDSVVLSIALLDRRQTQHPAPTPDCDFHFNIGGGFVPTAFRLVETILLLTHSTSKVAILPALANSSDYYYSSLAKSKSILGHHPRLGLKDYIEDIKDRTVQYLHAQAMVHCTPGKMTMKINRLMQSTLFVVPHVDPNPDEIRMATIFQRYYASLQKRYEELRKTNPCKAFSGVQYWGGFRSLDFSYPICANDDGTSGLIKHAFCEDIWDAIKFVNEDGWKMTMDGFNAECPVLQSKDKPFADMLPICDYDCAHPTTCFQTGRCRCVEYGRCPTEKHRFPSLSEAFRELRIEPPYHNASVLLPLIQTSLGRALPIVYPKLHIVPRNLPVDPHCGDFVYMKGSCFSATARFLETFKTIESAAEEAELFVVPFYQPCDGNVTRYHEKAISYQQETSKALLWIMVHDWSKCAAFYWDTANMRAMGNDRPPAVFHLPFTYVLQTNGDSNTNCFHPSTDIVIPPQTCNTPHLLAKEAWQPILKRNIRIYMASKDYGSVRKKVACPGLYRENNDIKLSLYWDVHYRLSLNRFCLSPRGVAGWSPRLIDAVGMGCIPVILADYTVFPYQQLIDYTSFAVFVREVEVPILEDILDAIPPQQLVEMQLALAVVRDSLLYSHYSSNAIASPPAVNGPVDLAARQLWLMRREFVLSKSAWERTNPNK